MKLKMDSVRIKSWEKSEIRIIKSNYITDDIREFEENVNELLKDGWVIRSTSCDACVFFDKDLVVHRYAYTAILYKETYK